MLKLKRCKRCGADFEGHWNAQYCPGCKPLRRLETDRIRGAKAKGSPVAEGKWRCPVCGCFKDRHADTCANCFHNSMRGNHNVNWKGGRSKTIHGHVVVLKPEGYEDHKHRYILEHRLIWEQVHGRLPKGMVIHHLNGVKDDNRPENLAVLPRTAHSGSAVLSVFKARIRQLEEQLNCVKVETQEEVDNPDRVKTTEGEQNGISKIRGTKLGRGKKGIGHKNRQSEVGHQGAYA